ncbi:MAG TPA: sulfotransferase [Solirubrobacteraceae bacterium]|nr:sulfotransferase [Solirubrobacteraceae bacterium]
MSLDSSEPVCVLGLGRSGTSLTMRLLNLMGVELGPEADLVPPTEVENPRGYWEPRWMLELNDEILSKLGTDWWHPLTAPPGWERLPELDPLRERARALLEEKFGDEPVWGWKESRTTLTLPFWRELLPDVRYVICLRNPMDAISSFQRRPEPTQSTGAWGDLWLEYTARALVETRGHPSLLVFYEDYFRDGPGQIARLASFLGLSQPETGDPSSRLFQEIEQSLRHHSTSPRELAVAWGIAPAARMLFLALRAAEDLRRQSPPTRAGGDGAISEAIERLAPELLSERQLLNTYSDAAAERLDLVNQLERVASERLDLVQELDRVARSRLGELEAAAERIDVLEAELSPLRSS